MRLLTLERLLAGMLAVGVGGLALAQRLPPPLPPSLPQREKPNADDEDVQVLARGPIHEAFASTAEMPAATPLIGKRPPDPVEELPPDQKPDGENVQWLPGYWHFDEERKDFIWISGFWRNAPAGRVWVPGDWREVKGGHQWVPGFWNVAVKDVPAQLEYLPPPPDTIESGPTVIAPSADCFYTPGCWVYSGTRYKWRPGFWVEHRRDWVWVPDHYRWTTCGYVFIPGFWDRPLATRGVLFAPVYFRAAVLDRPRYVYTPVYAVPDTSLHTSLFVRTGHAAYYFGDYYEPRYATVGYTSWCGTAIKGSNFAVGVTVTRTTYDPLWNYYAVEYRQTPAWQTNITTVYAGRYKGEIPRPPTTLVQQTNVTNVTNNTNIIVNNNPAPQTMLAPLTDLSKHTTQAVTLNKVKEEDRVVEQKQAKETRQVAVERRKVETNLVDKGLAVTKDDKPRSAKLEVPKAVALRAQAPAEPEKAPPPAATAAKKVERKPEPTGPARIPPIIDVKTGSVTQPKLEGTKPTDPPKLPAKPMDPPVKPVDPPKPPLVPVKPVDPPKPPVKVDPPVKPVDPPKPPLVPVKPVDPPKLPPVKPVDPPVKPVDPPKLPPKPVDPPKVPVVPVKVDPPKPPVKVDPPVKPVDPPVKPVVPPPVKVDPPKPPVKVDPPKKDEKPKDEKPKEKK